MPTDFSLKFAIYLTVVFGLFLAYPAMTLAADYMKTTGGLIVSPTSPVTSSQDYPFSLYIGDSLAGVATPVKSLYVVVSGVYTGGGTVAFSLDSNSATEQTFTLPSVTAPTPFELLYKDPIDTISPTSAGTFSHSLRVVPSGLTLYAFTAALSETHRYAPTDCPDGSSGDKMKTQEFFVLSSPTLVTSGVTAPLVLFIGDNLQNISTPLKSVHFSISGVYTGGGTLTTSVDSHSPSQKTYIFPSVSSPTAFELLYSDAGAVINPTTAGSYTYTFGATPSGISISGLGVKAYATHRYNPVSCGFPVKGELYSAVFDTTENSDGAGFNSILWKGVLGGPGEDQGNVRFQFAASSCANGATNYPACSTGTWSFIGGSTCSNLDWFDPGGPDLAVDLQSTDCFSDLNDKRYFRYVVELCSDDCTIAGSYTPRVDDVIINWAP